MYLIDATGNWIKKLRDLQICVLNLESKNSATGNWTRVIRVTGGYTNHYTITELWTKELHWAGNTDQKGDMNTKKPPPGIEPGTFSLQGWRSTTKL